MKHIVAGDKGQIGIAIKRIFACNGFDSGEEIPGLCDCLHICFPYSDQFTDWVKSYQLMYKPKFTIVHSTVKVGTCRELGALSSPCRGIHPNLYEGILTFEKFIGGEQASLVADEFRKHGMKVILCDKQETTELGKLLDTEYYRACIEFTHRAKELSLKYDVPFAECYTLFNQTYNSGYVKLDHPEYIRPVLQPIMKEIGGHCVVPNSKLI